MVGVHKAANRHSSLHCCACSCSLSGYMIIWSRTDLQIEICRTDKDTSIHRSVQCITRGTWLSLWESCRRSRLRGKTMAIPKDNSQLENARRLRSEMTPHERKLAMVSFPPQIPGKDL